MSYPTCEIQKQLTPQEKLELLYKSKGQEAITPNDLDTIAKYREQIANDRDHKTHARVLRMQEKQKSFELRQQYGYPTNINRKQLIKNLRAQVI
jgi:hypothetical protein